MIGKREKRKKFFYVPGMISLVLIPFFCFCHFYKTDAFKDERSIDIFFPSDSIVEKQLSLHKRIYHDFNFNDSEEAENKKLQSLQYFLRKLYRENDTINGVKIHLGNKMTYDVYIRILDILIIEKMPNYVQYKNDFFVLMLPKPKPNKNVLKIIPISCGYYEANKEFWIQQEQDRQFAYILSLYKKYWILFLGYFFLVLINAFTLVKLNKNR